MQRIIYTVGCIAILLLSLTDIHAQRQEKPADIYEVNRWLSGALVIGGNITNYLGQVRIRDKDPTPVETILGLDPNSVPGFDRIGLRQNLENYKGIRDVTDFALTTAPFLPLLLGFDRNIRHDWLDVFLVYAETQTLVANVYAWSPLGPTVIERYRPEVYYDEIPIEDRVWGGNRNSFYSGHVSTIAVGCFFTVQALMDAHPEMKQKAWMWYGLAAAPTAYIGWLRVKGLKHFPSDIVVGGVIGIAGSILVPRWHRKKSDTKFSIFANEWGKGMVMVHRF